MLQSGKLKKINPVLDCVLKSLKIKKFQKTRETFPDKYMNFHYLFIYLFIFITGISNSGNLYSFPNF